MTVQAAVGGSGVVAAVGLTGGLDPGQLAFTGVNDIGVLMMAGSALVLGGLLLVGLVRRHEMDALRVAAPTAPPPGGRRTKTPVFKDRDRS